jgi:hypothetical protein
MIFMEKIKKYQNHKKHERESRERERERVKVARQTAMATFIG